MSVPTPPDNKRVRGPSQRITNEVFSATLSLLQESGSSDLNMEAIAERAGVHKTTLYRRWGSVNNLIKAAIANVDMGDPAFQDTGSLAGDIKSLAQQFAVHFRKPEIVAINRLVAGSQDNELKQLMDEYWLERNALFTAVVERALARGETIQAQHFPLAIEAIVGPMLLRLLMTRQPIDDTLVEQLGEIAYRILTSNT